MAIIHEQAQEDFANSGQYSPTIKGSGGALGFDSGVVENKLKQTGKDKEQFLNKLKSKQAKRQDDEEKREIKG